VRGRILPHLSWSSLKTTLSFFTYHRGWLVEWSATHNSVYLKVTASPFIQNRGGMLYLLKVNFILCGNFRKVFLNHFTILDLFSKNFGFLWLLSQDFVDKSHKWLDITNKETTNMTFESVRADDLH
jgi:hypothetical protein